MTDAEIRAAAEAIPADTFAPVDSAARDAYPTRCLLTETAPEWVGDLTIQVHDEVDGDYRTVVDRIQDVLIHLAASVEGDDLEDVPRWEGDHRTWDLILWAAEDNEHQALTDEAIREGADSLVDALMDAQTRQFDNVYTTAVRILRASEISDTGLD